LLIIAVVGRRVAELVRKLKAVLRPVSIPNRQSDPNAAARRSLEIGLRMIGTIVDIDTIQFCVWAVPLKFERRRL